MSSAVLYAAIVAIWAGVLVPRWLRLRSAMPRPAQPVPAGDDAAPTEHAGAPPDAAGQDPPAGAGSAVTPAGEAGAKTPAGVGGAVPPAGEAGAGIPAGLPAARPARSSAATVAAPSPAERRASVLRARRRMLAALALLTAVPAGLTLAHLAPRWVVAPPALMLAGLVVLLRAAARSDSQRSGLPAPAARPQSPAMAGQAEHRTPVAVPVRAVPRSPARPAAAAGRRGWPGALPETRAQVIDISGRLGDQLYDQYADAAERAVGD